MLSSRVVARRRYQIEKISESEMESGANSQNVYDLGIDHPHVRQILWRMRRTWEDTNNLPHESRQFNSLCEHKVIIEKLVAENGGALPSHKWLKEHGHESSYVALMKYPAEFAHIRRAVVRVHTS